MRIDDRSSSKSMSFISIKYLFKNAWFLSSCGFFVCDCILILPATACCVLSADPFMKPFIYVDLGDAEIICFPKITSVTVWSSKV